MSIFFPHPAYAEDQPLPKTILTAHVIYRGAQTGTAIGIASGSIFTLLQHRKALSPQSAPVTSLSSLSSLPQKPIPSALKTIEISAGRGFLIGAALMAVTLPVYMSGKEDIEWADRSWRLLENKGQVEVDSWSLAGATAGLLSFVRRDMSNAPWRSMVGRSALGSMLGVSGYMVWRYGVMKGKRDQENLVQKGTVMGGAVSL